MIPEEDDRRVLSIDNLIFEVLEIKEKRITKTKLTILDEAEAEEAAERAEQ